MPSATTALGYTTTTSTQSQSANNNEGNQMTINDKIASILIEAEVDDKGLKEWDEAIDEFVFGEVEQMTYGWDLDDEEFDSFKDGVKQALLAQVDFNKVDEAIAQANKEAVEKVNSWLDNIKDMRGL
jgi:hypothetical protein